MADKYTILIKGETKFKNLTEEEYFDIMDDLAVEYYQTGRPRPSDIETKVFGDYKWQCVLKSVSSKTGLCPENRRSLVKDGKEHEVRRYFSQ